MSEKWFVVSESELVAYGEACLDGPAELIMDAEAACRARSVVQDVSGVWLAPIEEDV
jgi:hypothetical protein